MSTDSNLEEMQTEMVKCLQADRAELRGLHHAYVRLDANACHWIAERMSAVAQRLVDEAVDEAVRKERERIAAIFRNLGDNGVNWLIAWLDHIDRIATAVPEEGTRDE